jgi:threonine/homoserine/homoserine lactone efflux protein
VVQIAVLGVLLVGITTISDLVYALVSGTAGGWLRASARVRRVRRYLSGGVYLSLGISAADRRSTPRPLKGFPGSLGTPDLCRRPRKT